ncbi:MAG TPA: SNF2-related protein, partial [Aquabacterium sp.]|nr:SNF2-related protein [Aquabacterium sp.]
AKKVAAKKVAAKKVAARKAAPKKTVPVVAPVAEAPVVVDGAPPAKAAPVAALVVEPAPAIDAVGPVAAVAIAEAPVEPADEAADTEADAPASTDRPERSRRSRNRRRKSAHAADPQAQATIEAVLAVLAAPADVVVDAPAAVQPAPEPEPEPEPPAPPTGPAHSQIVVLPGDAVRIAWQPGHACPPALKQAAQRRCDAHGLLSPADDGALPQLLRLAQEGGHTLQVDEAVWAALAAHRDARHRLGALEAAYPDGPASAGLQHLLRVPLPLFQAEGALFAVVAGRALIADERGLGKTVQAIAAAQLWRRHFGVQRVLVLCAPAQRAAWQRAWHRLAGSGDDVQVIDGSHHQRAAQWSAPAGVRIAAPEALQTDAAHLAHWAPDLVVVDEPQQLGLHADDWAALATAPQALVLSGAPLADLPALMDGLVAWLDLARLGPLAALRELQAASRGERQLGEDDVEQLSDALSRLMLQRSRDDVAEQLPPVVHSERLVPLAPGQRAAHDRQAAVARRLLAGWQASGWCSDSDQWRLAQALRAMQDACHRADPTDPASPLAEATVQALAATLDDLAATGAPRAAVLCASAADHEQLTRRLAAHASAVGVPLLLPGEHLPGAIDVVLQAGVPWRPRRAPGGPRGEAPAGQQWLYLVGQDGIDCGLFDTLAARLDLPRSPADAGAGGARGWLQGDALQQWLGALHLALAATPAAAG